jgi:hypothetical protein
VLEAAAYTWTLAGTGPISIKPFTSFGAADPSAVADTWRRWLASDAVPLSLRAHYLTCLETSMNWAPEEAPALMEPLVRFLARRVTAAMRAWQLTQEAGACALAALHGAALVETPDGLRLGVPSEGLVARYEQRRRRLEALGRELAMQGADLDWYQAFCRPVE